MQSLRSSRDQWRGVLMGPARPAPHSSLAADDQVFPSLPPSSIAWSSISLAVHAFDRGLDALARDPEQLDSDALPCFRTALLHACTALVVLSPARSRRIDHALRMAWTAFGSPGPESSALHPLAPFPNILVVREAAALLATRSFTATPRWTDQSSVRMAASHMVSHVPDPVLFEATVRHLWREDEHDHSVRDDASICAESVAAVIERCLQLWQARVRPLPAGTNDTPASVAGTEPSEALGAELRGTVRV